MVQNQENCHTQSEFNRQEAPASVSATEDFVVHFRYGLPGFEMLTRFVIRKIPKYEPLRILRSEEDSNISMMIADPRLLQLEKPIRIPFAYQQQLHIEQPTDMQLYVILRYDAKAERLTANTKAPIVVNTARRMGLQIILEDPVLRVEQRLFENHD